MRQQLRRDLFAWNHDTNSPVKMRISYLSRTYFDMVDGAFFRESFLSLGFWDITLSLLPSMFAILPQFPSLAPLHHPNLCLYLEVLLRALLPLYPHTLLYNHQVLWFIHFSPKVSMDPNLGPHADLFSIPDLEVIDISNLIWWRKGL